MEVSDRRAEQQPEGSAPGRELWCLATEEVCIGEIPLDRYDVEARKAGVDRLDGTFEGGLRNFDGDVSGRPIESFEDHRDLARAAGTELDDHPLAAETPGDFLQRFRAED